MSAYVKSTEVRGNELTIVVVGEPADLRAIALAVRNGITYTAPDMAKPEPEGGAPIVKLQDSEGA